jgi:hypothetical protein
LKFCYPLTLLLIVHSGIISDRYGSSMNDIWPDGGRVSWYENPCVRNGNEHWKRRYIGKSPGMHRIKGQSVMLL